MAITSADQLINKLSTSSQTLWGFDIAAGSSFAYSSMWMANGDPGGPTSAPANEAPTSASPGAIPFTNPSGSNTLYLCGLWCLSNLNTTAQLYDRLSHMSGLSATVTTSQTVNTTALTRYTSGDGVQIWVEVYTALGATSKVLTVTYTNSAGTSGQTSTVTIPASPAAGRIFRVPLATGDTGVKSVQSVQLNGSMGTAGNFGITLAYPLKNLTAFSAYDYLSTGMIPIQSNACLAWIFQATTTSAVTMLKYNINLVEG